jgi:Fe-S-cluster containining protein
VWVNKAEIAAMAAYFGLEIAQFEAIYARMVGIRKSLTERPNGDCVLLDEHRKCRVYSVRPRQCRSWPFWESNVSSPERWEYVCETCPGAGTGALVPLVEIEKQVAQRRV